MNSNFQVTRVVDPKFLEGKRDKNCIIYTIISLLSHYLFSVNIHCLINTILHIFMVNRTIPDIDYNNSIVKLSISFSIAETTNDHGLQKTEFYYFSCSHFHRKC